jgi:hypothetical protein
MKWQDYLASNQNITPKHVPQYADDGLVGGRASADDVTAKKLRPRVSVFAEMTLVNRKVPHDSFSSLSRFCFKKDRIA